MPSQAIQHLLDEHRSFEPSIAQLESIIERAARQERLETAAWQAAATLARELIAAARVHVRKEEQALFPALDAYLPRETGPLAVLCGEHHDLLVELTSLAAASQALAEGRDVAQALAEFRRAGQAFLRLLRDHFYKEERVLFPMVVRLLAPERDTDLLAKMQAVGAEAVASSGS